MTIALDGTPLTQPTGGVARYTWELIRALAETFPEDRYWLLSDQSFPVPAHLPPNLKIGARPQTSAERRWWLWGLNRELQRRSANIFHGTDFSVPYLAQRPSVMTLHDLSPWHADWTDASSRVRRRTPQLLRLGLASFVITPTQAIRKAAIERFKLAPSRVIAVPLAARAEFRPKNMEPAPVPYFLFVGTLETRKNVTRLVEAWKRVRAQFPIDLVLVGRARKDFPLPAEHPGLRILHEVPDADLPGLYSAAFATVYPSLYEGFGLPVLEAMQCGSPVITSIDPAITEVAGGAAMHVDAQDTQALAAAMLSLLQNPAERATLRERGLERASQFSWQQTARLTREVYAAACARS